MKYGMMSNIWKHPGQITACYFFSAAAASPGVAYTLIYVLHDGMWWRTQKPGRTSVCGRSLQRRAPKVTHPSKLTKCKEGNCLDSACNRDCKTWSPEGLRQSSSCGELRGFGLLEMSPGSAM